MTTTATKLDEVLAACRGVGSHSIIVLSGVAGTGKSHVAWQAAQALAGHPLFIKSIQFHPSFTYEQFVEGYIPNGRGGFDLVSGPLLDWNDHATADAENTYVLLIEELSRANVNAVLGELMTYLEHRDRPFFTPYSPSTPRQIADNLVILATMNPRDRSALEVDDALIRRLWIVECPPDVDQLREMLAQSLDGGGTGNGEPELIDTLVHLFDEVESRNEQTYGQLMPFGHGMFASVRDDLDLWRLWEARIKHLLRRPLHTPHPYADLIEELYPWRSGHPDAGPEPVAETAVMLTDLDDSTAVDLGALGDEGAVSDAPPVALSAGVPAQE